MKALNSKKTAGKKRGKKRTASLARRVPELIRAQVTAAALFLFVKFVACFPFLHRWISLAMRMPLNAGEEKFPPRIVIFGISKSEQNSLVSKTKNQNYAVVYPNTSAIAQCVFLAIAKPAIALVPAERSKQMPPIVQKLLRVEKIPVVATGEANSLNQVIDRIDVGRTVKFFPALFYQGRSAEKKKSFTLILHNSRKFMHDVATALNAENVIMLPSKSGNEACLRSVLRKLNVKHCLAPKLKKVPNNLLLCLKKAGIKAKYLSQETKRQFLLAPLTPQPPFPDAPRAVLLNMTDASIFADSLASYHIFSLKNGTAYNAVDLLRGYTFVWMGNKVPKKLREAAARNSLSILHFCESPLSRYGWRKSYPVPLWLLPVGKDKDADTVYDRHVETFVQSYSDSLDAPQELKKAKTFLQELLAVQDALHRATLGPSGRKIKSYGKLFVLALWQNIPKGLSLEDFLYAIAAKEKKGKILVLALKGSAVSDQHTIPAALQKRCAMLSHLSDFDDYLEKAACVHVHGSEQGIEAIFRGKRTVAHAPAWYTGWGLTEDLFSQQRPRTLTREQLALASFLSFPYTAPFSFERITPRTALAFWYTRQRPDLGRFYEAILKAFRPDSRFDILDLRASFHNEPDIDPAMGECLRTCISGRILADMLSFSLQMPALQEFLSLFPADQAMDVLSSLLHQAYYQLNYEQINYILHRSSEWFNGLAELSDKDIARYYRIYHNSIMFNWFHDSRPPVLRLPASERQKSTALLFYAKILAMCFAYDALGKLASEEASNCSPAWYADLLFSLYNTRRFEVKETNIDKHVELRLKFFELYRNARVAKGLKDFSASFILFMQESLKENRVRMRELALEISATSDRERIGRDEQDMILLVVNMLRKNLEHELATVLITSLLPKEIAQSLMDKERLFAQEDTLHGQRAKKRYIDALKSNLKASIVRNDSTKNFASKLARGKEISIYRYYLDSAAIVNKAPTVRHPKGIIFFGHYGTFFSAILPIVLYSLRKRGYAVWPMYNNHIPLNVPFFHPLAKFAYALPHASGPLQLEWTIDYEHKRIEAVGVNFYSCFFEAVTILLRRYEFDWESPDIQRQFRLLLKRTDSAVAWIHNLCGKLKRMLKPPKVAVLSEFAYNLPESAIRVYLGKKGNGIVHFVYYKNVANYDLVHSRSDISTRVSGLDMTLWTDCRLTFLPARSRFNPWYEQRKDSPEFRAALEEIRQDLLSAVTETHDDILDYLREQKACGKRIICCIGRLLYDQAEHKPGGPVHEDISDWLRHSVEIASANPNIIVLIRPHPHESNPTAAIRARQTLRDVLPRELPPNVLYVDPLVMTVQSLIGIMDLAVIWLGTAAWELSALGIPCAVMSNSGYDQVPFNAIFPKTREEYVQLLATQAIPQPDEETQLRAAACLYYVKTATTTRPYPYAFVRGSNSFRTVPWYRKDLIEKFMTEGDENIEFVVDQITEGIPIN